MYFDQFRKRVESVLRAGKRPERRPFFAHVSPKVASVPLPLSTSVIEKEMKNGSILEILLLPDTLPPLSAYVALGRIEHLISICVQMSNFAAHYLASTGSLKLSFRTQIGMRGKQS